MDKYRKKRAPNYTFDEKENLLSIIAKYQNIIDCKRTGAQFIFKKHEAWKRVCKEFNSICKTGFRSEAMLKHFYNNIKHRSRKDNVNGNKKRYFKSITDESTGEVSKVLNVIEIKELKKKWMDEKKNSLKADGSSCTPTLRDVDPQIISILRDQIQPVQNMYEEAAEYFGEADAPIEPQHHTVLETNSLPETKPDFNPLPDSSDSISSNTQLLSSNSPPGIKRKPKHIQQRSMRKVNLPSSVEALKRFYYRKKIEIAYYQKRNEIQKFRLQQKKHELEMLVLKKQLEKLDKN